MAATVASAATAIKGTHYRIVKLDACGNPVTGTGSLVVVSKGFVQVTMEPQYEDGEEFFERTADGTPCVNQKDDPVLKRMQLQIQLCEINTSGLSYLASARELTVNGAGVTGTGFAIAEGSPTNRYSLEVWQRVAGSGACDPSGLQRYIYNAWPNVGASKVGTYTIENGRSTLQVTSETQAASMTPTTGWGDGPGSVSWLPSGESVHTGEHWLWNITTTAPPTPQVNPLTLS
ncbi:hypothetical protein ACH4F6_37790 [Streptomyces sp. NPDC017936]|uniref:hypothetical protein n=1 Tax=Streptomyces sp. NPDC017936 TaxID=3365016 RepID=UPI0037A982C7